MSWLTSTLEERNLAGVNNMKKLVKIILLLIVMPISFQSQASDLKVFGPEFCSQYDAGSCINFHYKKLKDKKNLFGRYKYPKGKAAYDKCKAGISGTDGEFAYCSMLFHYAEQSKGKRKQMCHNSVKNKYNMLASAYSYGLYLRVWGCN